FKPQLIKLTRKLNLNDNVNFFGWISSKRKNLLLKKAHCLCVPSVREGWGLVVLEANCVGTPAIVYNVPGLRDAVKNRINGIITLKNTPQSLAECLIEFFNSPILRTTLSKNAFSISRNFNWDKTAEDFLEIIEKQI
ncbi:MAG: glycosyltransferase, partial [Desulfobacterota bacterium]|nr:glycosyltransferase [Thermodesulfobacteriota bacterium]